MADDKIDHVIQRLINIELKQNQVLQAASALGFSGTSDQAFGHFTYAQHGEDLIVANIFALIGIRKPTYMDVGAHHPTRGSNTALLYSRGSRGVNIEANPDLIQEFYKLRPEDISLNVGVGPTSGVLDFYRVDKRSGRNSFDLKTIEEFVKAYPKFAVEDVVKVKVVTLNDVIKENFNGVFPDFLSIDVEGLDYDVLKAADFSHSRPKVMCVEVTSGNKSNDHGKISNLMTERGFLPYIRTWGNTIFVVPEVLEILKS